MIRCATKVSRLPVSCLLPTLLILVVCYVQIAAPPKQPRSSRKREITQPPNATDVMVVDDNANPHVIYGSNKSCPEFVPKHDRGARIILLAYAR